MEIFTGLCDCDCNSRFGKRENSLLTIQPTDFIPRYKPIRGMWWPFLTLNIVQLQMSKSKVTNMKVSGFSECFLFYWFSPFLLPVTFVHSFPILLKISLPYSFRTKLEESLKRQPKSMGHDDDDDEDDDNERHLPSTLMTEEKAEQGKVRRNWVKFANFVLEFLLY